VVVIALTAAFDLRGAIGFSGVTILTYYAITNAACLTLSATRRRWPSWIAIAGLAGCITLAVTLPLKSVVVGAGVLLAGLAVRGAVSRTLGGGVESVGRPGR
jgi:APA family basic amino acid/polyamine antiporter